MKLVKLLDLTLRNFKGIRQFSLQANGEDIAVYGDNAVGKTTLFDAFIWLLFNKDSNNRSTFEIKTLDESNQALHGLEHEVSAVLEVDGKLLTLKKVYKEKWTKKRGSADAVLSGHTTDHYIDDVPAKQKEYESTVSNIVDEEIFKLLTSPTYFNEQLKKEQKRALLLEICGDITDDEVVSSSSDFAKLPEILSNRSVEGHKKMVGEKLKEINRAMKDIPVRIDEAHRSMPDVSGMKESDIREEIDGLHSQVSEKQDEINRIQSGEKITSQQNKISELEGELQHIKNQLQAVSLDKVSEQRRAVAKLQERAENIEFDITRLKRKYTDNETAMQQENEEAEKLRNEWHAVNAEEFTDLPAEDCPTCGQSLPSEQVEEAKSKALSAFNASKSERLERITERGKQATNRAKELQEDNALLESEIAQKQQQYDRLKSDIETDMQELERLKGDMQDVSINPDYQAKQQEIEETKKVIASLRESNQSAIDQVRNEIANLRDQLSAKERDLAKFAQIESTNRRIDDLKNEERKLAKENERLEMELFLIEEFTRAKYHLLESRINSKFKFAQFKLFRDQVNGGIDDVCETLYKGVPYSGGLNNAARINVGLDIINTLSEHYGLCAPIFVDNSESITQIAETSAQLILLVVSAADKELRLEKKVKEAV